MYCISVPQKKSLEQALKRIKKVVLRTQKYSHFLINVI